MSGGGGQPVGAGVCFLFRGEAGASAGEYGPLGYRIRPRGDDVAEHHLMHLHEIHHKVLTDDTSWGSLVHVAARHCGWGELLGGLFHGSRTVQESFASYMSLSLARARHDHIDQVLGRYPIYMPLALRMENYLRPVTGSHRAELAATGIARWCMSAPVLDLAVDAYPRMLTLADIPAAMRPDHRFRLLLSAGRAGVGAAARVADRVFEATCGQRVDTLGLDALDAALDSAWGLWEDAFVDSLVASAPRLAALPTKQRDGHLDQADALVRAAHEHGIEVELPRVTDSGTLSDVESTQRLLQALSLPLREVPYAAVVATAGADVDVDAVLALGEASPLPHLVVQGRRPSDLARTFVFGESDRRRLARFSPGPVFAVRSLVDDGEGGDLILNTVLEDLQALKSTRATWAQRGVAAVCVAASCFLRSEWQAYWSEALRAWPTVVLMDMGLAGMVGEGRLLGDEAAVHGTYMGLGRHDVAALVWHVDGHPHVMLALGDDLTIQLIAGQLHDLLGDRLVMEDADWSQWLDVLSAVASNVLATEPFLRFDASTEEPAAEGTHRRTLPTPPSVEGRDDV